MDLISTSTQQLRDSTRTVTTSKHTSSRLNETYKGTGGGKRAGGATRSRSAIRDTGRNNGFRSTSVQRTRIKADTQMGGSSNKRQIKDAHERFRDRIINGRDINDVEEELSTERAKNVKMESVIKMKESQIVKYSKGLEKAKGILKGMVESTQSKMAKLQEKVDSLQAALLLRDEQLREKNREISSLTSSGSSSGHTTESLRVENERMRTELESYRSRSKNSTDRFEGRQVEWQTKNTDLSSNNHRLTGELARVNAQLQRKIRDDQEKTAEIERLNLRLLELEGGSFSDQNARNMSLARAQAEMATLEGKLAGVHAMMSDVEFFVSIKNELDDFETFASQVPSPSAEKENIFVPQLKSEPTFAKLIKTTDCAEILEVQQRMNREIEEDRVNCRRALKELQSQSYILNHSYDDLVHNLDVSSAEAATVLGAFGDIEASLEKFNEGLKMVEIYGDVRDNADNAQDVNKLLAGFRDDEVKEKPSIISFSVLR